MIEPREDFEGEFYMGTEELRMAVRPKCSLCGRFIICSCGGCASNKGTCLNACPHERSSGDLAAMTGRLCETPKTTASGHRVKPHKTLDQLDGTYTD